MLGLSLGSDKACHPVGLFMVTITDSMGVSGDEDLIKLLIQHLSVIVYESDLPTFLHCYGCACTHCVFLLLLGLAGGQSCAMSAGLSVLSGRFLR